MLTQNPGPLSDKAAWVQGATGGKRYRWTTDRKVHLATGKVTHSFLHVPDCPYPLLGRDLLTKLKAQIHFEGSGAQVVGPMGQPLQVLTLNIEDEYRLHETPKEPDVSLGSTWLSDFPQAWAETGGMGLAVRQAPLIIPLKATSTPVSIKQYPMSQEARLGIKPHIQRLLDQGILVPCQSPWNTPLLPVKKPGTNDYRPQNGEIFGRFSCWKKCPALFQQNHAAHHKRVRNGRRHAFPSRKGFWKQYHTKAASAVLTIGIMTGIRQGRGRKNLVSMV